MQLGRLNLSTIIFNALIALSFGRKFTANLIFPFSKFIMNNTDFNSLILNLSCKDMFSNIKECAEQCYYREKHGVGCVGFLKFKNTEECYVCNPVTVSEMISNNMQINETDIDLVYILKYKKKKPVMYLSLEGDNITDTTVIGEGVNGTLINNENTQIQDGKVNQGLRIWNRARLVLDGTTNKCIGNLTVCTSGLSIMFWVKLQYCLIMAGTSQAATPSISDQTQTDVSVCGPMVCQTVPLLSRHNPLFLGNAGAMSQWTSILRLECLSTWKGH